MRGGVAGFASKQKPVTTLCAQENTIHVMEDSLLDIFVHGRGISKLTVYVHLFCFLSEGTQKTIKGFQVLT